MSSLLSAEDSSASTHLAPTTASAKRALPWAPEDSVKVKLAAPSNPCPSYLFYTWLNTSFSHHSVSLLLREVGNSHICLLWALLKDCLSSPLTAGGTVFPGQREWSSPKILSHLSMEFPNDQPIPASHYGRTCLYIFMPPWLCHKIVMLASGLQGEQAAETQATHPHCIPFTWQDLGSSKLSLLSVYVVLDQRLCFLSSSSPSQSGGYFRRQYRKQGMHRMLLPPTQPPESTCLKDN